MTAPARIMQEDVTRVMKGARKAGFTRVRLSIDVQGNIVVEASDEPEQIEAAPANPLDRILRNR